VGREGFEPSTNGLKEQIRVMFLLAETLSGIEKCSTQMILALFYKVAQIMVFWLGIG
jgi:hypothetical protein